jgi:anti-sigma B factor antagonist
MGELDNGGAHATVSRSTDASGATVVSIIGEVDMSNATAVDSELQAVLRSEPALLVVDLSALEFIDSSGIALLLRAAEKTARLELRNPSVTVQRVIAATGLSGVLHVQP